MDVIMANDPKPKFIVAEISKKWPSEDPRLLLSHRFEQVINHNLERGYKLHSWKLISAFPNTETLYETIVAVFERADDDEQAASILIPKGYWVTRQKGVTYIHRLEPHWLSQSCEWSKQELVITVERYLYDPFPANLTDEQCKLQL